MIKKIIPYIILITVFLFVRFYYSNLRKNDCQTIINIIYNCIVTNKKIDIKDHYRKDIQCEEINTKRLFNLDPLAIDPPSFLYDHVDIGDTIRKHANSNVFIITNTNKIDSFSFSCD